MTSVILRLLAFSRWLELFCITWFKLWRECENNTSTKASFPCTDCQKPSAQWIPWANQRLKIFIAILLRFQRLLDNNWISKWHGENITTCSPHKGSHKMTFLPLILRDATGAKSFTTEANPFANKGLNYASFRVSGGRGDPCTRTLSQNNKPEWIRGDPLQGGEGPDPANRDVRGFVFPTPGPFKHFNGSLYWFSDMLLSMRVKTSVPRREPPHCGRIADSNWKDVHVAKGPPSFLSGSRRTWVALHISFPFEVRAVRSDPYVL